MARLPCQKPWGWSVIGSWRISTIYAVSWFMLWHYNSLLTGFASRPDIYGGKSELSTARDRFDDDAADLRRDGSTWTMRICARGTGGRSAVWKVWFRDCWSRPDPPKHNHKHASAIWHKCSLENRITCFKWTQPQRRQPTEWSCCSPFDSDLPGRLHVFQRGRPRLYAPL